MSRLGDPYDNAIMEGILQDTEGGTFGRREIYWCTGSGKRGVRVQMFYNSKRMHSALGYLTPKEYEHCHM
jgi:putative transposase